MIKRIIILLFFAFACISWATGQSTVSGTVTDAETGDPLIGATVMAKGTEVGAVTDIDGKFSLKVPEGANTLEVLYTGFATQEISIDGQSTINVQMKEGVDIEEVVVIGYATQKKSNVTGAISQVKEEDLEDMQIPRVEQALQGRTSGVRITQSSGQPGSGSTVRIRGTSSLNGADPLWVVDGVVIGGGIDFLNPNDIKSIEVLKDAASTAIYGARGANGVIIVTTKSGRKGKMQANFSAFYGVQNPWKKLPLLNAREYAIIQNEMAGAAGEPLRFENPDQYGEGTDWQDEVFNYNAPISSNELSLSGGSDKLTYYSSIGYLTQEGIVSKGRSNYSRLTGRLNVTSELKERVNVGVNIAYTHIDANGVGTNSEFGSPLGRALNIDPITPLYETDEDVLAQNPYSINGELRSDLVQDDNGVYGISPYVTSEIVNPVAAETTNNNDNWSDKLVPSVFGELEIIDGLKVRSSFGGDLAFWGNNGFTPVYYLNATNVQDTNSVYIAMNRGFTWIWDNTISYDFDVAEHHDISIMAGHSAQETNGRYLGGSKRDVPSSDPFDATIDYARNEDSEQIYGGKWERYAIESYFSRLNYDYKGKYLFTATMRADATTKFGSNYRWGYFPAVSLGWNVADEEFWVNNDIVNTLKIRGGWGRNGNDAAGSLEYVSTISGGSNYTFGSGDTQVNGTSPSQVSNPDLRWETVEQLNFGADMRLFRNYSLTFDYFIKSTYDVLTTRPIPAYVGNNPSTANVGDMQNKGFDLELGYDNDFNGFELGLSANVSYVKNEVLLIGNETGFLTGAGWGPQGIEVTRNSEGLPVGYFFGYQTDGIFQNQAEIDAYTGGDGEPIQPDAQPGDFRFIDVDGDGTIGDEDRGFIGDPTPSWTYGFTLNSSFRNFDLTIFGQGVAGNSIFNATRRYDLPTANMNADALGRWTGEGTSNSYPRLTYDDTNINFGRSSTFYVEDGAFFRIKTAQIGYTVPADFSKYAHISKARVYLSATNLWTVTNYSGFDPEVGSGVDRGIYPQARTYTVGLNVTFE